MVKKNKLLIGCLSLLLVLSVGYALFSETITINGTATAKGSFDITTTCVPGYSDELLALGIPSADYNQAGFENSICDVKNNVVTATTDLLYPTANRYFTIKMKNTGSISAVIWVPAAEKRFSIGMDQAGWMLKNKETDEMVEGAYGPYIRAIHLYSGIYTFVDFGGTIVMSNTGEMNSDESLVYDSSSDAVGIKLNPGEVVFSMVEFEYPDVTKLMSDNGKSEYFSFLLDYEFKWEQYTDSPNYEPTTFSKWCFAGC